MIVDDLINTLEQLNYPVFRQGSLTEDEPYPDTFITFWNSESADHAYYDNTDYALDWIFNIYVYSVDPALTYSLLDEIRTKLKSNGWIISGHGYDVMTDEPTHTGRGLTIRYLEV